MHTANLQFSQQHLLVCIN